MLCVLFRLPSTPFFLFSFQAGQSSEDSATGRDRSFRACVRDFGRALRHVHFAFRDRRPLLLADSAVGWPAAARDQLVRLRAARTYPNSSEARFVQPRAPLLRASALCSGSLEFAESTNGVSFPEARILSRSVYPARGSGGRFMSEMMTSNFCLARRSSASSVDVARTNETPSAWSDCRSKMLLSGRSSTHRAVDSLARRMTRALTDSATTAAASFASRAADSGVVWVSGRATEAATSAAAASACFRFAVASNPPPLKVSSP